MAGSSTVNSDTDIIDRMNTIRNSSEQHVERLHHEVERLKDWREHVKARPLLAVGVAAVAGFWLVSKLSGRSRSRPRINLRSHHHSRSKQKEQDEAVDEVATRTSLTAGAMALAGSLLSSAIRMAATHYLKSLIDKRPTP